MKSAKAERILSLLPGRELAEVRKLARYEPDVAGGLMTQECLVYEARARVAEVVERGDEVVVRADPGRGASWIAVVPAGTSARTRCRCASGGRCFISEAYNSSCTRMRFQMTCVVDR